MRRVVFSTLLLGAVVLSTAALGAATKKPTVSFSEDIFPILQIRCQSCHQAGHEGYERSGLKLDSYEDLMKGTKFGRIVEPGDEATSNLMVLLDGRADKSLQMPHGKKRLSICDRNAIRTWIHEGALNN